MSVTLLNATLVDMDPPSVRTGSLRIDAGHISEVGEQVSPADVDEVVDCHGSVVMPGLANGHTHLYSALAVGMPAPSVPPSNFLEILQRIWWRLDRAHDQASIRASGQVGALVALRCGTTTLIDHHASPNCISDSLSVLRDGIAEVGCRGLLCYEVTDRNGDQEGRDGLRENERFIDECRQTGQSQFAGMVGAHASFTLEDESLAGCVALCQDREAGLHIHVAEDPVDERTTRERWGLGLLERLQTHGAMDLPRSIFAHGTHLSASDIALLDERSELLTLAHNPSSNMNNGVGYTPVVDYPKHPVLGTDGIGADMWREARTALFKSNDAAKSLPFDRPLQMVAQSARFASEYLGCRLGVLAEGAAADLVVTRYVPATPLNSDNLAGHLIYALGPEYVSDVMIAGQWKLRDGQVVSCDETAIRRNAVDVAAALHARM